MWINLFNYVHNSLGMHFWDFLALIVGAVLLGEVIVHNVNQKKREKRFDEERAEKLEAIREL